MASKLHQGKCGPCYLCYKESTRYTHPAKMDETIYRIICDIEKCTISSTACICHSCYKQVSRNIDTPNYHPRWKTKPITREQCGILNCNEVVYRHTNIATPSDIESILDKKN